MIDFQTCADFTELWWRESRDQIDRMERSGRFPVEEIQRRRARLDLKSDAVSIVRIVADVDAIRELVEQQLECRKR